MVGYEGEDPLHNLEDKVVVRLIDTSYEKALERAKKIIEKKFWLLAECVEFKEE
jgi:hypothetical protein